jgi:hypothetical protein
MGPVSDRQLTSDPDGGGIPVSDPCQYLSPATCPTIRKQALTTSSTNEKPRLNVKITSVESENHQILPERLKKLI